MDQLYHSNSTTNIPKEFDNLILIPNPAKDRVILKYKSQKEGSAPVFELYSILNNLNRKYAGVSGKTVS